MKSWLSEHASVCEVRNQLEKDPDFYRQHKDTLEHIAFLVSSNKQDLEERTNGYNASTK